MTDPMELVGRLERRIGADLEGECHLNEDEARQIAACIRELVERQLTAISKDGPYEISRAGRFWLARQLLDSKLTDAEAYGIVAHHPAITDTLPPAPGAEA